MSAPTAANLARLAELAELCAVVSSAQICEAHMKLSGHVNMVNVYVHHTGCTCDRTLPVEFDAFAYTDDRFGSQPEMGTYRMDELLANLRAFLAQTYGFSLVRHSGPAFVPPLNQES